MSVNHDINIPSIQWRASNHHQSVKQLYLRQHAGIAGWRSRHMLQWALGKRAMACQYEQLWRDSV